MSTDAILEVADLKVQIASRGRTFNPVDGVSFTALRGQSLGLVGESGSGKSLTLRAILGLLPSGAKITGGSIRFEGVDLVALGSKQFTQMRGSSIGMVFQEPMTALNPVMPLIEQIAEGPRAHRHLSRRASLQRAVELMKLVGIPDPEKRAKAYPHEFSGGMRQRVMIAIALSSEPRLLLCDEPTTALDVTIQDQILQLLDDLSAQLGVSLIYVSHDLAVVAQLCQRVAVMYAGQLVESGSVEAVFRQPQHPYTAGLIQAIPDVDDVRASLDPIPGTPPDPAHPPAGCRFHPRCEFVQDDCRTGIFELRKVGDSHSTACIHPEGIDLAVKARAGGRRGG